ncbi:hypothetical protein AKO1_012859 [Acrasis kona]|uniref:Uncharacterized protein n=1 Tax=Acrasis kona TaxID=1008807 RepID=A0AAW2YVR5_9EUKA
MGNQQTVYVSNRSNFKIDVANHDITRGSISFLRPDVIHAHHKNPYIKFLEGRCKNKAFEAVFEFRFTNIHDEQTYKVKIHLRFYSDHRHGDSIISAIPVWSGERLPFSIHLPRLNQNNKEKKVILICPNDFVEEDPVPQYKAPEDSFTPSISLDMKDTTICDEESWSPVTQVQSSPQTTITDGGFDLIVCDMNHISIETMLPDELSGDLSSIKLFSSHCDDAVICASSTDNLTYVLSSTMFQTNNWYDTGADNLANKYIMEIKVLKNSTIVLTMDSKIYIRGQQIMGDLYTFEFVEFTDLKKIVEPELKVLKIGVTEQSFYILSEDEDSFFGKLHRISNGIIEMVCDNALDIVQGRNHIMVITTNGLIWYKDDHGDFVPDHSLDLRFENPSTVRFLISNEKSSLLWTWDNRCFVVGNSKGLASSDRVYSWTRIFIDRELLENSGGVKQIVPCAGRYYFVAENGSLWSSCYGGVQRVTDIRIQKGEYMTPLLDENVIEAAVIGEMLLLLLARK